MSEDGAGIKVEGGKAHQAAIACDRLAVYEHQRNRERGEQRKEHAGGDRGGVRGSAVMHENSHLAFEYKEMVKPNASGMGSTARFRGILQKAKWEGEILPGALG